MEHIKLHLSVDDPSFGGEWVWAEVLEKGKAKIANIPFFVDSVTLDDTVSYCPDTFEVIDVIEPSGRRNRSFKYLPKSREGYSKLREGFSEHKIRVEGASAGFLVACVPPEVTDEQLKEIARPLGGEMVEDDNAELAQTMAHKGCSCCGRGAGGKDKCVH